VRIQAGLYLRISQDRTGQEAGVARQEKDCRVLASEREWDVVDVFTDNDVSAYSGRPRPAYQRMLNAIRLGRINAVIAWHTDRLYRQPKDLEGLIDLAEERGVKFATVKAGEIDLSTPTTRAMARVGAIMNRLQSEQTAERLKAQRLQQASEGRRQGGGLRCFGYTHDMRLVPDEAKAIQQAASKLLAGVSVYRCNQDLNVAGVRTPQGNPWRTGNLAKFMVKPTLAGLRYHEPTGTITKGAWPAILTEDQHALLQQRLRSNRGSARPGARRSLLSGLLRCHACGRNLVSSGGRYVCDRGRAGGCGASRVDAKSLEAHVSGWVESQASESKPETDGTGNVEAELLAEIRSLEERLDTLAENIDLDERQVAIRSKKLRERRDALQAELNAAAPAGPLPKFGDLVEKARRYEAGESTAQDIAEFQDYLRAFVRHIVVATTSASVKAFTPESVEIVARAA